jgi:hypothetical protein
VKVNIDVDCTPDEARTFFGLPNVKPIQEVVMAKMEQHLLDASAGMSPDAIMKMWLQFMPQDPDQFRDIFTKFFAGSFDSAT